MYSTYILKHNSFNWNYQVSQHGIHPAGKRHLNVHTTPHKRHPPTELCSILWQLGKLSLFVCTFKIGWTNKQTKKKTKKKKKNKKKKAKENNEIGLPISRIGKTQHTMPSPGKASINIYTVPSYLHITNYKAVLCICPTFSRRQTEFDFSQHYKYLFYNSVSLNVWIQ